MAGQLFDLGPSSFGVLLARLNRLDAAGFAAWDFLPGMLFGERAAWWRGGADRGGLHEGLDLARFRTRDGRAAELGAGARVPAAWAGEVVAVLGDFLGRSVFVRHAPADGAGRRLHSAYGHLDPEPGLAPGSLLREGDVVGAVAAPPPGRTAVPPHLHLTLALIAPGAPLGWEALHDAARVTLLDPLPLLQGQTGLPVGAAAPPGGECCRMAPRQVESSTTTRGRRWTERS